MAIGVSALGMDRELDFIVIGAQKGGTTSLWQYLRSHPQIVMPDYKEASVFCMPPALIPEGLAQLMDSAFTGAPADARLGKVSTHYMRGAGKRIDVAGIVELIADTFPDVRLIALLRDPVERAISHYRMSLRRGFEDRSLDEAVEAQLEPDGLEAGRSWPSETNSYVSQGEYGRILRVYGERFEPARIHVEATADLAADPGLVLDRVLGFLELPRGYRPDGLGVRHHKGGSQKRLDPEGEAQLRDFVEEQLLLLCGADHERMKMSFDFFMATWNVIPDEDLPVLSGENRRRLQVHYRSDAELLSEMGIAAPWLEAWIEPGGS